MTPRPPSTPLQRWRRKRDLLIYVGSLNGFSQRDLADVFDLPQSRVSRIVRNVAALGAERAKCSPDESSTDPGGFRWGGRPPRRGITGRSGG
jgi:hypothetical protein